MLLTGDLIGNHYPNIDIAMGGGIDGTIRATDMILTLLTDHTRVVPGHGPVLSKADVIAYRDMLRTARDRIARAKASGVSEQQVLAATCLQTSIVAGKAKPTANRFRSISTARCPERQAGDTAAAQTSQARSIWPSFAAAAAAASAGLRKMAGPSAAA